jgi:hypothetical protein
MWLPDHLDPARWILDHSLTATNSEDIGSIDPVRGVTNAATIAVGIASRDAAPDWSLGAYLHCAVPSSIGSYSGLSFFNGSILLNQLAVVSHPVPASPSPSIEWRLSFPRWLYSVDLEVWQFVP